MLFLAAAALSSCATSSLTFSNIIANGVLQRNERVSVWGSGASPSAVVTVTGLGVAAASANANADGHWMLEIATPGATWNATLTAASGGSKATTTVSYGEVVMCAGQR